MCCSPSSTAGVGDATAQSIASPVPISVEANVNKQMVVWGSEPWLWPWFMSPRHQSPTLLTVSMAEMSSGYDRNVISLKSLVVGAA